MKRWYIVPLIVLLLAATVSAKCGDSMCDPEEDCESCPDDCLCTKLKYDDVDCCTDFTCLECEKGYCHDRKCDELIGFTSLFQKAECYDNGSIHLTIKFLELKNSVLTPVKDLRVYMKVSGPEESFKEINGTWYNPSKDGDFRYTKIEETSYFDSVQDIFKEKGKYYIRVKYKMSRSNSIFQDLEVECPGVPKEEPKSIPLEEKPIEPEIDDVDPPKKEFMENNLVKSNEIQDQSEEDSVLENKSDEVVELIDRTSEPEDSSGFWKTLLFVLVGLIIVAGIIFFIKYEFRIIKRV